MCIYLYIYNLICILLDLWLINIRSLDGLLTMLIILCWTTLTMVNMDTHMDNIWLWINLAPRRYPERDISYAAIGWRYLNLNISKLRVGHCIWWPKLRHFMGYVVVLLVTKRCIYTYSVYVYSNQDIPSGESCDIIQNYQEHSVSYENWRANPADTSKNSPIYIYIWE